MNECPCRETVLQLHAQSLTVLWRVKWWVYEEQKHWVTCSLTAGCVAGDSLRFLVIGDMGGLPTWPYATPVEVGTADEMAKVAKQYSVQFILELGDNFYYDGVKNVEDKRFEVKTKYIYTYV